MKGLGFREGKGLGFRAPARRCFIAINWLRVWAIALGHKRVIRWICRLLRPTSCSGGTYIHGSVTRGSTLQGSWDEFRSGLS